MVLKYLILLLCVTCVSITEQSAAGSIAITETNFKDKAIRKELSDYDKDRDGFLSEKELKKVVHFKVNFKNKKKKRVNDLSGLEKLTYIETVDFERGVITDFAPISELTLKDIYIADCVVKNFSPAANPEVKWIRIARTNIDTLDLSENQNLEGLQISDCGLETLDISKNKKLEEVYCNGSLKSLQTSELPKLYALELQNGELTEIRLSDFPDLNSLYINGNHLKKLDLSSCENVFRLVCSDNQLKQLDLSNCKNLRDLECANNQLEKLDTTKCKELYRLNCSNNWLNCLQIEETSMKLLDCTQNYLTELPVKSCNQLEMLFAGNNQLEKLDLSSCLKIHTLKLQYNPLKELTFPREAIPLHELQVQKIPALQKLFVKIKPSEYTGTPYEFYCDKALKLTIKKEGLIEGSVFRGVPGKLPDYYWEDGPSEI